MNNDYPIKEFNNLYTNNELTGFNKNEKSYETNANNNNYFFNTNSTQREDDGKILNANNSKLIENTSNKNISQSDKYFFTEKGIRNYDYSETNFKNMNVDNKKIQLNNKQTEGQSSTPKIVKEDKLNYYYTPNCLIDLEKNISNNSMLNNSVYQYNNSMFSPNKNSNYNNNDVSKYNIQETESRLNEDLNEIKGYKNICAKHFNKIAKIESKDKDSKNVNFYPSNLSKNLNQEKEWRDINKNKITELLEKNHLLEKEIEILKNGLSNTNNKYSSRLQELENEIHEGGEYYNHKMNLLKDHHILEVSSLEKTKNEEIKSLNNKIKELEIVNEQLIKENNELNEKFFNQKSLFNQNLTDIEILINSRDREFERELMQLKNELFESNKQHESKYEKDIGELNKIIENLKKEYELFQNKVNDEIKQRDKNYSQLDEEFRKTDK